MPPITDPADGHQTPPRHGIDHISAGTPLPEGFLVALELLHCSRVDEPSISSRHVLGVEDATPGVRLATYKSARYRFNTSRLKYVSGVAPVGVGTWKAVKIPTGWTYPAMPATGKSFKVPCASVGGVRGRKLTANRDYWSNYDVLKQLGFLRSTNSSSEGK